MVEYRAGVCSMNRSNEERRLSWPPVLLVILCWLALGGCLPKSVPLASLPMEHPTATDLNLNGIDQYHAGQWMEAFESFDAALQIDPDFVEAHFNVALALHQMDSMRRRPGTFDGQESWILGMGRLSTRRCIGIIWDCLRRSRAI